MTPPPLNNFLCWLDASAWPPVPIAGKYSRIIEGIPPSGALAEGRKLLFEWCSASQFARDQVKQQCPSYPWCAARKQGGASSLLIVGKFSERTLERVKDRLLYQFFGGSGNAAAWYCEWKRDNECRRSQHDAEQSKRSRDDEIHEHVGTGRRGSLGTKR